MMSVTLFNFLLLIAAATLLVTQAFGARTRGDFELRPRRDKHKTTGKGKGGSKGSSGLECYPGDHTEGFYYSLSGQKDQVPISVDDQGHLITGKDITAAADVSFTACDSDFMGYPKAGAKGSNGYIVYGSDCLTVHADSGEVKFEACASKDDETQIPQWFGVATDAGGNYAPWLGGPNGKANPRGFDLDSEGTIISVEGDGSIVIAFGPSAGQQ